MYYLHSIAIPETPEDEFLVKSNTINRNLNRTGDHGEKYNWDRLQNQLDQTYNSLNPTLKEKYFEQYENLSWEINFWKEMFEREAVKK
ncbi:hypothetical protein KY306_00470 [Candidatus Woesearchaeota archaeon]|nr:hypothetical protein [Candidatus Woesearchaeota archaeon]